MKRIQNISFPRSGQGLLVRILIKYFSRDTELERGSFVRAGEFVYCEYYSHCKLEFCSERDTTWQKNHDLSLDLQQRSDVDYIVQYRNPTASIISLFKLYVRDRRVHDTQFHWVLFFRKNFYYFQKFYSKWCEENRENIYSLPYERFIAAPLEEMIRVIEYTYPEHTIDVDFLREVINSCHIEQKDKIQEFKYTSPQLLEFSSRSIEELLDVRLGLGDCMRLLRKK